MEKIRTTIRLLFLKALWHYKTLRGWWWVFRGIFFLRQCGENPNEYCEWLNDIEASSWFSPATLWPFSAIERSFERRRAKTIALMESFQRNSTWLAWRLHWALGIEVEEARSLLEKGEWEKFFNLVATATAKGGGS